MKPLTALDEGSVQRERRPGVRAACNVLSTHLGVPKVECWAAPLVRSGLLPRMHEGFTAQDAAILLLTVLGVPDPSQAAPRSAALTHTMLIETWEITDNDAGQWRAKFGTEALLAQPATPCEAIARDLEDMAVNASAGTIQKITVRQDETAVIFKCAGLQKHFLLCYGAPLEDTPSIGLGVSVTASD